VGATVRRALLFGAVGAGPAKMIVATKRQYKVRHLSGNTNGIQALERLQATIEE